MKKMTTWAIVALLTAAGTLIAVMPARGCPAQDHPASQAHNPPKAAPSAAPAPAPTGHRSFVIAARMGWL